MGWRRKNNKIKTLEIRTERLCLKPITRKYLRSAYAYSSDPEVTKYMYYYPHENKKETKKWLKCLEKQWKRDDQKYFEFAILLDGVHIGEIGVDYTGRDYALEFGWMIRKEYWGNGYVTEAAKALRRYAIDHLGGYHFVARCDAENVASRRVMEKLNMQLTDDTGTRKNRGSDEIRQEVKYENLVFLVPKKTEEN